MLSGPFLATQSFPFSVVTVRAQAISIVSAWTSDLGALMHILYVKKHLNIRLQAPTNSPPHDLDGSSPISNIGESVTGLTAHQLWTPGQPRQVRWLNAKVAVAATWSSGGPDWPSPCLRRDVVVIDLVIADSGRCSDVGSPGPHILRLDSAPLRPSVRSPRANKPANHCHGAAKGPAGIQRLPRVVTRDRPGTATSTDLKAA